MTDTVPHEHVYFHSSDPDKIVPLPSISLLAARVKDVLCDNEEDLSDGFAYYGDDEKFDTICEKVARAVVSQLAFCMLSDDATQDLTVKKPPPLPGSDIMFSEHP